MQAQGAAAADVMGRARLHGLIHRARASQSPGAWHVRRAVLKSFRVPVFRRCVPCPPILPCLARMNREPLFLEAPPGAAIVLDNHLVL